MPRPPADPVPPGAGPAGEVPHRDARERVRLLSRELGEDAGSVGWVPDPPDGGRRRRGAGRSARPAEVPGGAGDAGSVTVAERGPADEDDADTVAGARGGGRTDWAGRLVGAGPWGALAERWVPETMRQARVDPGRRGAALLAVVAALAAVVAAVGVWSSRPTAAPVAGVSGVSGASVPAANVPAAAVPGMSVPAMSVPAPAGATGAAVAAGGSVGPSRGPATGPSAATASSGPILVSVTGRVRHPGLVTVPADARVADAIAAAGGVLDAADLTGLNLAAHVSDGASVVVAGPGGSSVQSEVTVTPGAGPAADPPGGADPDTVDINRADLQGLQRLPGVGPVTAGAILEYRTRHGPFTDVAQLQEVSGIGPVTFARIAPHVTL